MNELLKGFRDRIADLDKAQKHNYKTVREELAALPDYSEQLKNAVETGNQAEYEKIRRKADYVYERRIYLEASLDAFADENNVIPHDELEEMTAAVRKAYNKKRAGHAETFCRLLDEALAEGKAWQDEASQANGFIRYANTRGGVKEDAWLRGRVPADDYANTLLQLINREPVISSLMNSYYQSRGKNIQVSEESGA